MRRNRLLTISCCVAVLVVVATAVWCVRWSMPLYDVTFLPSMGGVKVWPYAINDSGHVAATVQMANGAIRVVLWDKSGRTEDLASYPGGSEVRTVLLNNAGQVACTARDPNHTWVSFFRDADGRRYVLEEPDYDEVQIGGMNNRGQVVGYWNSPRFPKRAFLWEKTTGMQDLGTFDGTESRACDLNDAGQVVGFFGGYKRNWRAFLCDPNLHWQDLGPARYGWDTVCTCRINNQGFVVGHFGSDESRFSISTWTAHTGSRRLPVKGDLLSISGLDETNRYFVTGFTRGIRVGKRALWLHGGSSLWESRRRILRLDQRLCRVDSEYLDRGREVVILGCDLNKDGAVLTTLGERGQSHFYAAILEPTSKRRDK